MNDIILDPVPATAQDTAPVKPARHNTPSSFRLQVDDAGVGWLTFDLPGTPVNIFNEATFGDLDDQLEAIEHDRSIRALVIRSAKDKVFIAGADLKSVRKLPPEKVNDLLAMGQTVFNRLAALPLLKVAMIHGACVGGGYELALACDMRIASDDNATRIGLPETLLGLIPAWGGSTRLPRLIGLTKALGIILAGKVVKPLQALKMGMVDDVVAREHLERRANALIRSRLDAKTGHPSLKQRMKNIGEKLAMPYIAWQAKRDLTAKTRGLYAAPMKALEVVTQGYDMSIDDSLALERRAVTSLVRSSETGRLIDLFFKKEEADKKALPKGHALPVTDVAVIGAGVMGAGIAHWLAGRGIHVTLTDVSAPAMAEGMKRVQQLVNEGLKRRAITRKEARDTMDHIIPATTAVPLHRCQLIIEAATEDLELKKRIFAGLAERCHPDTILATNTSALSVKSLAGVVPHPERVIGLHFFNPVHRMPLVEVITLPDSSDDALATAFSLVQRIGKTPVLVKDSPGFVVNRVLIPYLMEAVRLFAVGHDPKDIDEAMLDFGMPMGPMRLLDEIGLDVAVHVARTLMAGGDMLHRMVDAGWLGRKSGRGFYLYKSDKVLPHPATLALRTAGEPLLNRQTIQARLDALLSDEAARCLQEGVATTAHDIDLAMVLGTGYPAFRGGPLAHLLTLGNPVTNL